MTNIEKITPENSAGSEEPARSWQEDLANQPQLDSESPAVERQTGELSRALDNHRVRLA